MTKNAKNICPKCQSPIEEDAPGGLCPKCVMGRVGTTADQAAVEMEDLPSIEQLASLFPQLEIMELIGRGGMGFVFKARQLHLDREVALKLLPEKLGADPHFTERFTREARVLAKLSHPNIVMVHDFGHTGGFYYLVMEYVEGLNLRQAMRMGKFSPSEALAIVPKICEALQFAHEQGVLHRDIKPENILLDARGRLKIADFGIAKMLGEDATRVALTGTGSALGTPHYMAPEQFENPSQVDHRADIYSLGVVFYEMLTGELPIGRFSAPSERTELDQRIDAIVLRALAKERELRQKDARELQNEVETVASKTARTARATVSMDFATLSFTQFVRKYSSKAIVGVTIGLAVALLTMVAWRKMANRSQRLQWQRTQLQLQGTERPPQGLTLEPINDGSPLYFTNASPILPNISLPVVDPEKLQQDEEKIEAARGRYEAARERHSRGEISDRDLALANRDLIMAEARGNAEGIAQAHYDFVQWDFRRQADIDRHSEALHKTEQELNKAQHALERARATNEVQKAFADLKYAERALGTAGRGVRLDGVVTNSVSPEALKKLQNDYFYSDLNYKRLKQNQEPKQ